MGTGSSSALTAAVYVGSGATALDIRNNIFVNTQTATSTTQKNYGDFTLQRPIRHLRISITTITLFPIHSTGSAILAASFGSDQTTLGAISVWTKCQIPVNIAPYLPAHPTCTYRWPITLAWITWVLRYRYRTTLIMTPAVGYHTRYGCRLIYRVDNAGRPLRIHL